MLQATFAKLKEAADRAEKANEALPDTFVLAQTFENQKEYFKEMYADDDAQQEQITQLEAQAKEVYEKLYPIYDRTSDFEIIEVIYKALQVLTGLYKDKFDAIGEMTNDVIVEMFEIRDQIKILFDELEVWLDKFEEKEQLSFEGTSQLFEVLKPYDEKIRNEMIVNNQLHIPVNNEARRRLIRQQNGVERYNFWWWYAGV